MAQEGAKAVDSGIKYELRSIGGGYSEGSSVMYDDAKKKMHTEINLYGGSKKAAGLYDFSPPTTVAHLIDKFFQAKRDASAETANIQAKIASYKTLLSQEIDKEVVAVLASMDKQMEAAIKKAIRRVNYKFK